MQDLLGCDLWMMEEEKVDEFGSDIFIAKFSIFNIEEGLFLTANCHYYNLNIEIINSYIDDEYFNYLIIQLIAFIFSVY